MTLRGCLLVRVSASKPEEQMLLVHMHAVHEVLTCLTWHLLLYRCWRLSCCQPATVYFLEQQARWRFLLDKVKGRGLAWAADSVSQMLPGSCIAAKWLLSCLCPAMPRCSPA